MSADAPRPPRLSRALLEWAARLLAAPELAEDAAELFAERVDREGEPAARRWYRRQTRAALARLVLPGREPMRARAASSWLAGFSLDAKLGARMLAKYPVVTVVGGLAMTIGIGLGAAYLEVVTDFLRPTLPFDEGDRIVGLQNWDQEELDPELRSAQDFLIWRDQLESVQDLGAFRAIERNLGIGEGTSEPAAGAEITPSAFRVVRTPALLGRTLVDADERDGAPAVIVLGYDLWRSRFAGDAGIVGQTVRLGAMATTVVGVMPQGFAFPISQQFWVPLRAEPLRTFQTGAGPAIQIFGRLAPGVSLDEAQSELGALGLRAAADAPDTHARLRPRIVKYTELFVGGGDSDQAYLMEVLFVLLLLVLGSNVATMVFARTATRENEIAMRFALGASRGQILAQFFVEALVLALGAAVLALAAVAWGTNWVTRFFWQAVGGGQIPFWLDRGPNLNVTTILTALGLAVLGALVAGVMPALKATGSRLRERLRHAPGVGASALRFGGLWSALIVVQVAFAVLVLPPAIVSITALAGPDQTDPGFAGEEYLSARIEMEREQPPADSAAEAAFFAEFEAAYQELRRRLSAEAEISRVTVGSHLPGMDHPQRWVDVDSAAGAPGATHELVMTASVEPAFFDAFGADVVSGRAFGSADAGFETKVVVVNEHFVTEILQGRSAIGRRFRYSSTRAPGPTYEIVGVVSNLGMDTGRDPFFPGWGPGVYHPLAPAALGSGGSHAVRMAFHVRGDASSFAPRLRALAGAVHPALRLYDVLPLDGPVDRVNRFQRIVARFFASLTALVGVIALLISIAGTYSVLAFTVARQTREIGIRIALGADRRRIVTGVFSRAMIQIGTGIIAGSVIWFYVIVRVLGGGDEIGLLAATVAALLIVGALACGVPVRRALRIEPTEALREVG